MYIHILRNHKETILITTVYITHWLRFMQLLTLSISSFTMQQWLHTFGWFFLLKWDEYEYRQSTPSVMTCSMYNVYIHVVQPQDMKCDRAWFSYVAKMILIVHINSAKPNFLTQVDKASFKYSSKLDCFLIQETELPLNKLNQCRERFHQWVL